MRTILILAALTTATAAEAQNAEKQLVMTITSEQLKGGVVSEITWDGGALVLQGVFAQPSGELAAQYFVQPARGVAVEHREAHTEASERYWEVKSKPLSPTGLGRITTGKDAKMPMYGIASQEQRIQDAANMGGTQVLHTVRLGDLLLYERTGPIPPYDGEVWGWSAAELNKIAYVDKSGDLWIASADGRNPHRVMRGSFTLPAWSDDGRQIAVAERKNGGRKWEIWVITLPREEAVDRRSSIADWRFSTADRRLRIGDRRLSIGDWRSSIHDRQSTSRTPQSTIYDRQSTISNPPPPAVVLQRIRAEAGQTSHVMAIFDHLVTVVGPRLTGSPAYKAAAEWCREKLASFGLVDATLEPFEFGRGWALDKLVIEMVEPRYMPLHGYAEAWSASTRGELLAAPVLIGGRPAADVAALAPTLSGGIVLSQPMVVDFVREDRPQPAASDVPVRHGMPPMPRQPNPHQADASQVARILRDAKPGVVLRTSAGEHGTVFVLGRDQRENAVPSIVLAAEHYNMVARMVERGVPVKLRVNLQTRFLTDDTKSYNVLAEIPGTDPALQDEVVLLGAHLDSWHTAPGATDNADGVAAAMEAVRILKTLGVAPRRTIRIALWGGEEQGLLGSRAHVAARYGGEANAAAREKLALYLNLDPGMGPIYGWYLENSAPARALFDAWIAPLKDLGVLRNVDGGLGSTDHVSFRQAGIAGFNPVQDYVTYDVRTHHTNVDTYERIRAEDLEQNAIVLAWFVYNAAMTDEKLPAPAK